MYPEFKTWTISFKDRETFNKISDWDKLEEYNFIDIGYSDMILVFDKKSELQDFEGFILDNNITYSEYILGGDEC